MNFAIFRVGKKFKSLNELKGFERHTERKQYTPNADTNIENEVIIGSGNVAADVEKYIEGIKLRKNGVLARDLLLTTSPEWMKSADSSLREEWINKNIKWLKSQFGDNLIYCCCHNDEKTLHLHALIVPRFYDSKRDRFTLSNRNYFNGAAVLSEWQDKYSKAMEDFGLNRGLKWSKAKHTNIKVFYSLINKDLNEKDLESLTSKAKNGDLLNIKIKRLQKTLNSYKNFNKKTDQEKEQIRKQNIHLFNQVQEIKKDKDIYKECIRTMSELYKIPQNAIEKVIRYVSEKSSSKEIEREK